MVSWRGISNVVWDYNTPFKLIGTFWWTNIKSSMLYRNTIYSNDGQGKEQVKVVLINEKWRKSHLIIVWIATWTFRHVMGLWALHLLCHLLSMALSFCREREKVWERCTVLLAIDIVLIAPTLYMKVQIVRKSNCIQWKEQRAWETYCNWISLKL